LLQADPRPRHRLAPSRHAAPLLWHWLYFPPLIRQSQLGEDGHTRDSGLFAGGPVPAAPHVGGQPPALEAPLRIGDRLTRRSEVTALTPKVGASGRLLFVTIRHTVEGTTGGTVIEETGYRPREPAAVRRRRASPPRPPPGTSSMSSRRRRPSCSASPPHFNAHRIHYDHPYATEVEG